VGDGVVAKCEDVVEEETRVHETRSKRNNFFGSGLHQKTTRGLISNVPSQINGSERCDGLRMN
jgi:hypothetical protein